MVADMDASPHTFSGRTQLTLALGLFAACAANVVLVCVWL
jgi:hypothetical protein